MFIRKTKKSNGSKNYYCYQLIESIRTERGPRQRILITLGSGLDLDKDESKQLANRIEEILTGTLNLFEPPEHIEQLAKTWADKLAKKQLIASKQPPKDTSNYQQVDINTLNHEDPRQAGIETIAWHMIQKLELPSKLTDLMMTKRQVHIALGIIIHRLANPGSERFAHKWLREISALDELIGCSFQALSKNSVYQAGDRLLERKDPLETQLAKQQSPLFDCKNTIYLYDLTNTFFEGQGGNHRGAKHGVSKEKRRDCPLITLGLVINQDGFVQKSRIYPGNISETTTLQQAVNDLIQKPSNPSSNPILVIDAGFASSANLTWLRDNNIPYITVCKHRQPIDLGPNPETLKSQSGHTITVNLKSQPDSQEVELHCYSQAREEKEKAIEKKQRTQFEEQLNRAHAALNKKSGTKKYDKVIERIGRLKERHRRIASYYDIEVIRDNKHPDRAQEIKWTYNTERARKKFGGGYILKAYNVNLSGEELWRVYTQLTEVEAAFRSLKSTLGLRPIYHRLESRIDAHLFITLLAYHVLHAIRFELKQHNIHHSWEEIRRILQHQTRVTTSIKRKDGKQLRVRTTTKPTTAQREIYSALRLRFDAKPTMIIS